MGLAQHFDVNEAQLESAYKQLQAQYHPDRLIGKSSEERVALTQTSVDVTKAYQTLKNPLQRAIYMLKLKGINALEEGKNTQDPELLMESMEAREALEESDNMETIQSLINKADKDRDACIQDISSTIDSEKEQSIKLILRLRYLEKLIEKSKQKQKQYL